MKIKNISITLVLLALLITLTLQSTYAATSDYKATKVYAVALSCPYHFTLSVQDNNNLVVSGNAPDYVAGANLNIAIIKPVNYTSCTVSVDGSAKVTKDTAVDLEDWRTVESLNPTIVKNLTHALTCTNDIAPIISVKGDLTIDLGNVPKLNLDSLNDGIYNLRVGLSIDPAYANLYCDNILIVVQCGKASLQLLPNYTRYITYAGSSTIYRGYSLYKWDVRPAITVADEDKWLRSSSGLAYSIK